MTKQNEKDAKRVPELRFKGFTDDWEQRKFSDIYKKSSEKNDLSFSKDKVISVANNKWGTAPKNSTDKYMRTYYVYRIGDIAFEGNKSKKFKFGRFVENTLANGIVSHVFDIYRPTQKEHDLWFWKYYIHNENIMRDVLRKSTTKATMMTNLVNKDLLKQKLNIPILEEQKKIGRLFNQIDRTITLHEEKQHQLEQLKKALLQKMFADKTGYPALRFKGFTEKWEQRKPKNYLRESRILGSTGVDAKKLTVKLWGKGVVEKKESISGSNNTRYYIRHAGQLMYGKLDFLHAAFGIVPKELDKYESTADSPAFDIIDGNPKFLLEFFLRKEFYLRNGQRANGSRKAKRIHEKDFLEMPILVPYKSEQTKIGNLINSLDRTITLHDKKIQYLKQLKRGLLQKMFV
ncbi:restriction endonuclease subunit S [Limosilactobacillus allomucosae]|uniref:restriction endonuclease subunit S n=1 Tax=Limosilactobacillus allomucosae TaxID=3142938 RepID=UPI0032651388